MKFEKIVIVTRSTRLEENINRFNTRQQAKFFIEKRGQSFGDYEKEYDTYMYAREQLVKEIPKDFNVQIVDRNFLPNYLFGENDVVITLGQDGLVVNTAKYLNGQMIFAVNPDIERFDGVLMPFQMSNMGLIINYLKKGSIKYRKISMARVELNDGQHLYAFNDFFIGANSHISSRYTIKYNEKTERQISSGIIVSTPAGSTGWLSSIFNMANGIASYSGDHRQIIPGKLNWEDKKLIFVVREPFLSRWSRITISAGTVEGDSGIEIESHMPEKGVIFSDGMENDFLEFNSGATAYVKLADKTTNLVMKTGPGL
jgi:NAD kinase